MYYYSNCLLEALKVKIKDWNNVVLKWSYEREGIPFYLGLHFWWQQSGKSSHFFCPDDITYKNYLWHRGRVIRKLSRKESNHEKNNLKMEGSRETAS